MPSRECHDDAVPNASSHAPMNLDHPWLLWLLPLALLPLLQNATILNLRVQ